MTSPIYFWKDNKVHIYQGGDSAESIRGTQFTYCYAVDSANAAVDMRYGKYTKGGWEHVPLDKFPPEFRTALLLLGIT